MKSIKFYNEGADWSPSGGMDDLLLGYGGFRLVRDPEKADMIIFNGGADIATSIYNEHPISRGIPYELSGRDIREIKLFENAVKNNQFILGICRGAQLVNCLNGGSLWQDVTNHGRAHDIFDVRTGETQRATSTHHQMMIPGEGSEIIAVAYEASSKTRDNEHKAITRVYKKSGEEDLEICFYPASRSLCIQGHPEYVPKSDFANYCVNLIREKYNEKA